MIYYSIKLKKKMGLPRWRSVKVLNWQCRRCKRREFYPLQLGRSPWRRKWQPTPVFLPEEFHGQRSLAGYIVHGVAKSRTQLSECMCACTRACTHTHMHTHTHTHKEENTMARAVCAKKATDKILQPLQNFQLKEIRGSQLSMIKKIY